MAAKLSEAVLDQALNSFINAVSQDSRRSEMQGNPDVMRAVQRDAMRVALCRVLADTYDSRSADARGAGDEMPVGGHAWPQYPCFEIEQRVDTGARERLAVAPAPSGALVFVSPADTLLEQDRMSVFDLPKKEALRLSDALSRATGRLPEGATTIDKRTAEYLYRTESKLRETIEYLRKLPLNPMTAAQIRGIEDVLESGQG